MSYTHFSKTERLELSILLKKGYSHRAIAQAMGRNHSSVIRELKRNTVKGRYDPQKAQHKAYVRRQGSKYIGMKVRTNPRIEQYLREKMSVDGWSPECIAGRIFIDQGLKITAPSIYKYLYHHPSGISLCQFLKYKRYRPQRRQKNKTIREMIPNRVWLDARPEIINNRTRFGDFEVDTLGRSKGVSLATLVGVRERKTRKLFAVKVPGLKYAIEGFKKILSPYQGILESVTFDNGVENKRHQELNTATYFCHPYSSWEKGGIENGFKIIRQYIPKKTDLKDYSDKFIATILERINNTPMKCLGWSTPNEAFDKELSLKMASLKSHQIESPDLSLASY